LVYQTEDGDVKLPVRQEIVVLKKPLEAFRRQKRGLMQKLLTGRWRVKIKEVSE